MSRVIQKGATDRSVIMRAIDSTNGTPETGFAYNTAGIDLWYRREGGSVVSITEATLSAVDSAHSDGGVIHIRDGYFRLDAPDAAFATGANSVMFGGTATGMIICGTEIQLVNYNPEDGVRLGLTALPNAAADAAGGLPISDAGALDLDTQLATLTNGTYGLSAIETLVDDLESRLTATRAGYLDNLSAGAVALASVCTEARLAELAAANIPADIDTLISRLTALRAGYLDNLSAGAVALASGVTVSTNNDKTGYSLSTTPPTAAQVRAEIDSNSTQLAAIVADTNELQTDMANGGRVDLLIDAILADTAEIQAELADGGRTDLILDAILTDTNELQTDWANGGRLDLLLDAAGAGGDATAANQTTIINAIAALNDISTSDVLTQAASALNTYDPPTKAELDVAIAAVAGLTGSYARVITVQNGAGVAVIAANVEVWDSANTVFYQRLQTNSSGQVTFNMDAGTYTIRIFKEGYSFTDATLTISGAGSTTYNMTPFTTPTASNVNMCRVYGYFMTPEGGYYTTLTPSAVVEETYDSSNNFFKGDVTGGYVAASGLVYWDIVRGATARVRIPEIGYEAQIIVPDASSSKLDDLV
jgi:hypothetical protein